MPIVDERQLQATREKLRRVEEHYQMRLADTGDDTYARELSLQSLKRMIHQLAEEIVRCEVCAKQREI